MREKRHTLCVVEVRSAEDENGKAFRGRQEAIEKTIAGIECLSGLTGDEFVVAVEDSVMRARREVVVWSWLLSQKYRSCPDK